MRFDKSCLRPILPAEVTDAENFPLADAVVGKIEDKKSLSRVLKLFGEKLPLGEEFQFLKRVNAAKGLVLICIIGESFQFDQDTWRQEHPEVAALFDETSISVQKVQGTQARTRAQWMAMKKIWPCKFHEDKALESLLCRETEDLWGDKDDAFSRHVDRMLRVLSLCQEQCSDESTALTEIKSLTQKKVGVHGALLFDPATQSQVLEVTSKDEEGRHSLRHAVMEAIATLAERHRETEARALKESQGEQGVSELMKEDSNKTVPECEKEEIGSTEKKDGSYLCTGLDMYLSHEPCLMCSMALVHARIRKVFFCTETPGSGGLVSVARLQEIKSINHSFEVFQLKL